MNKETSANKLIKESWIGQSQRYEMAQSASQQLAAQISLSPEAIERPLVDKIEEIHKTQKLINQQASKLGSQVSQVKKVRTQLSNSNDHAMRVIKETGDVQNWAEMIDEDIRVLERAIKYVDERVALND